MAQGKAIQADQQLADQIPISSSPIMQKQAVNQIANLVVFDRLQRSRSPSEVGQIKKRMCDGIRAFVIKAPWSDLLQQKCRLHQRPPVWFAAEVARLPERIFALERPV